MTRHIAQPGSSSHPPMAQLINDLQTICEPSMCSSTVVESYWSLEGKNWHLYSWLVKTIFYILERNQANENVKNNRVMVLLTKLVCLDRLVEWIDLWCVCNTLFKRIILCIKEERKKRLLVAESPLPQILAESPLPQYYPIPFATDLCSKWLAICCSFSSSARIQIAQIVLVSIFTFTFYLHFPPSTSTYKNV